jgi:hypothetical protein
VLVFNCGTDLKRSDLRRRAAAALGRWRRISWSLPLALGSRHSSPGTRGPPCLCRTARAHRRTTTGRRVFAGENVWGTRPSASCSSAGGQRREPHLGVAPTDRVSTVVNSTWHRGGGRPGRECSSQWSRPAECRQRHRVPRNPPHPGGTTGEPSSLSSMSSPPIEPDGCAGPMAHSSRHGIVWSTGFRPNCAISPHPSQRERGWHLGRWRLILEGWPYIKAGMDPRREYDRCQSSRSARSHAAVAPCRTS